MAESLFPLELSNRQARRMLDQLQEYHEVMEKEGRYANVQSVEVWGTVEQDGTGAIAVRVSKYDGFCLSSGVVFRHHFSFTEAEMKDLISVKLRALAEEELAAEREQEWERAVSARAETLKAKFNIT